MNVGHFGAPYVLNGAFPPEDDGSGSDQDSSSSVSTVSSIEIASHFIERHGRLFHVVGQYPLPIDEAERQRLNRVHELVKEILGGRNYRGPVGQILEQTASTRRMRVLDICTGNGKWVEEMADEFPHVKVYGLDMVPLATRYPSENVQFEIHDIHARTRWMRGRFDIVHIRQVSLSPLNYASMLHEVARILRPGGLLLACEWLLGVYVGNRSDELPLWSHIRDFFHHLHHFAAQRRLFHDPMRISLMVASSAFYAEVTTERHVVALDGSDRGQRAKQSLLDFVHALRCFFLDNGFSATRLESLIQAFRDEIDGTDGRCLVYLTIQARRNTIAYT